jgi:hypothetical protein
MSFWLKLNVFIGVPRGGYHPGHSRFSQYDIFRDPD